MRLLNLAVLATALLIAPDNSPANAGQDVHPGRLEIPSRDTQVDLATGVVSIRGHEDPCLLSVQRSGKHSLMLSYTPGADQPEVKLLTAGNAEKTVREPLSARTSSYRLARDGSLIYLRRWKTGTKTTQLVQDGAVRLTWPRSTHVQILRFDRTALVAAITEPNRAQALVTYPRNANGHIERFGTELGHLGNCQLVSARKVDGGYLLQVLCGNGSGSDLLFMDTASGVSQPVAEGPSDAVFAPVVSAGKRPGETVALEVSGTLEARRFFHAVSGLLLTQTGEPKSCASDATGQQSWSQSYRSRAHALMYRKSGHDAFLALALKSLRGAMRSANGPTGRANAHNPSCGWGSRIYTTDLRSRYSLMVNQAMISNALSAACRDLGSNCPASVKSKIARNAVCLAKAFEPQFDGQKALYRIKTGIPFRYAGEIAPWNWQVTFAAVLRNAATDANDQHWRARSDALFQSFFDEWLQDEGLALWRYWPVSAVTVDGRVRESAMVRFEDTGHAGISLLAMSDAAAALPSPKFREALAATLDRIVLSGLRPARDIDGSGPKSSSWFAGGGWANVGANALRSAYTNIVPGASSADAIYAYAQMFDPDAPFSLTLTVLHCAARCRKGETHTFSSIDEFMAGNPLFSFAPPRS